MATAYYSLLPSPIDDLLTEEPYISLSSKQGKVLGDKCVDIYSKLDAKVEQETFDELKARVDVQENTLYNKADLPDLTALSNKVTILENSIVDKANSSDVSTLELNLTDLSNVVNTKADSTDVSDLRTYVDGNKTPLVDFNNLKDVVNDKANINQLNLTNNNLNNLTNKVNNLDTIISMNKDDTSHYIKLTDGTIILEGKYRFTGTIGSSVYAGSITFPVNFDTILSVTVNVAPIYMTTELISGTNTPQTVIGKYNTAIFINNITSNGFGFYVKNLTNTDWENNYSIDVNYHVIGL